MLVLNVQLFSDVVPKTAENFRALCTGKFVGSKTFEIYCIFHCLVALWQLLLNSLIDVILCSWLGVQLPYSEMARLCASTFLEILQLSFFYSGWPFWLARTILSVAGEKGIGVTTGKPLHYKGSNFHRIIKGFMAQVYCCPLDFSCSLYLFFMHSACWGGSVLMILVNICCHLLCV